MWKKILKARIFPIILIGIVVALLVLKLVFGDEGKASQQGSRDSAGRAVAVEIVRRSSLIEVLELNGTLRGSESIELRSEISGRVESIHFADGQPIKAGDLLVKINDRELVAELASARTQFALAKQKAERQKSLFSRGLVSKEEHDEAIHEQAVLNSQIALLRARFNKTELRAPFDGRIGLREISPGALITQTTPIARIRRLDPLYLDFSVPERYQAQVRPGMTVTLQVAGVEGEYSGEVQAIDPQVDESTRSLRLRATVPNAEGVLLPGNFADVSLALEEHADAIMIPTTAVERGLNETLVHVVDEEGRARRREVEVGVRESLRIQILSGLKEGERVIVRGGGISDGDLVRVLTSPESSAVDSGVP